MNARIKKKLTKRNGMKSWRNYYENRVVHLLMREENLVGENDIILVTRSTLKNPKRAKIDNIKILKNWYPAKTETSTPRTNERSVSVEFKAFSTLGMNMPNMQELVDAFKRVMYTNSKQPTLKENMEGELGFVTTPKPIPDTGHIATLLDDYMSTMHQLQEGIINGNEE